MGQGFCAILYVQWILIKHWARPGGCFWTVLWSSVSLKLPFSQPSQLINRHQRVTTQVLKFWNRPSFSPPPTSQTKSHVCTQDCKPHPVSKSVSFISTIYAECQMHHDLPILTNMSINIPEDSNPQRRLTLWSSQTCVYLCLISASQDHRSYTLLSHFPGEDMRFTVFNNWWGQNLDLLSVPKPCLGAPTYPQFQMKLPTPRPCPKCPELASPGARPRQLDF